MSPSTWIEHRLSSHFIQNWPRPPKRRFRFWPAAVPLAVLVGIVAGVAGAQTITEFPVPTTDSGPNAITTGPDGALWFIEVRSGKIGRITTTGAISEFATFLIGEGIAAGPDGNLWTANFLPYGSGIVRITTSGVRTTFGENLSCVGITAGPDGNLWFTDWADAFAVVRGDYVSHIGRITTAGVITEFPIPTHNTHATAIVAGPDSALWFLGGGPGIGRITTAGVITEFPVGAFGIATGPDGNLWLTEGSHIDRMTTGGVVTSFPVSGAYGDITAGPDGALWFTEGNGSGVNNAIGRITTAGVVTEFPMPTPESDPTRIVAGPDGALWFTEFHANKIGRITTTSAPVISLRALPVVGSTPGANGTFFKTSVQLHNPGSSPIAGQIVFHASGTSGSSSDPALLYSLAPGQTQSIADLLPAMFRSGLGSADIEVTSGSPPVATARVFNDAGAAGTTGFTEEAIRPEEALSAGARGVLLLPPDLTAFRFNIGVRTLELGASITLTVRDAAGVVVATVPRVFPAVYHLQQTAAEFLTGSSPPAGGSITVEIVSGSAIVYGATVDNITGDPSLQIARGALTESKRSSDTGGKGRLPSGSWQCRRLVL